MTATKQTHLFMANLRHVSPVLVLVWVCVCAVVCACVYLCVGFCSLVIRVLVLVLLMCNKLWKRLASNMDTEKQTTNSSWKTRDVGFSVEDLKDFHSRICNNVALLTRKTTAERQKKQKSGQKYIIKILRIRGVDRRAKTAASSNDKSNVKDW